MILLGEYSRMCQINTKITIEQPWICGEIIIRGAAALFAVAPLVCLSAGRTAEVKDGR